MQEYTRILNNNLHLGLHEYSVCLMALCFRQTAGPTIPPPSQLKNLVNRTFVNVDQDKDGFIEYYEFDTMIIVADTNSKYQDWSIILGTVKHAIIWIVKQLTCDNLSFSEL